jgi:hypothetical protein
MATVVQSSSPVSAPSEENVDVVYEDGCYRLLDPVCPACDTTAVTKNGTDDRHPKGSCSEHPDAAAPVRVQQYVCMNTACERSSFTPSLPFIGDKYEYVDEMRDLVQSVYIYTPATLDQLQDLCIDQYHVKPSTSAIDEWIQETVSIDEEAIDRREVQTDDDDEATSVAVVENPLPTYSGVYELDEFFMTIAGERKYRVTIWDHLMQAPVAEGIADRRTKDAIREVVEPVLRTKPMLACLTDGWSGAASLVADELGGLHYRCMFHKVSNLWEALGEDLTQMDDDDEEFTWLDRTAALRVATEVRQLLSEYSVPAADQRYTDARQRFEAVLDEIEHVPESMGTQLGVIDENFEKYAAHLREEWLPGTTNGVERYYSLTQPSRVNHRFQSVDRALSFLQTQMTLRTVKHGFVSRETSVARARDLFPEMPEGVVKLLFTDRKQRYLDWRDRGVG